MGAQCFVTLFRQWLYPQWKKTPQFFLCLKWRWVHLTGYMLVSGVVLMACSGCNTASTSQGATTVSQVALSKFHWCGKPLMVLRDEGVLTDPTDGGTPVTSPPKLVNDWELFKANLGFTVFLPSTLPAGACLMNASGTVHDPIFGGNFAIGYLLPDHSSISLSEAPLRSQNTAFQCSPSSTGGKTQSTVATKTGGPTQDVVQLCSGAHNATHIVLSARGATAALEQFFRHLQPDVTWLPA